MPSSFISNLTSRLSLSLRHWRWTLRASSHALCRRRFSWFAETAMRRQVVCVYETIYERSFQLLRLAMRHECLLARARQAMNNEKRPLRLPTYVASWHSRPAALASRVVRTTASYIIKRNGCSVSVVGALRSAPLRCGVVPVIGSAIQVRQQISFKCTLPPFTVHAYCTCVIAKHSYVPDRGMHGAFASAFRNAFSYFYCT